MRIFLAAPIFSLAEREFNSKLAEELRKRGHDVFLAQELGILDTPSEDVKRKLFEEDLKALDGSDVVVAVLDGMEVDSGVAFELGYAYARGKKIVGVRTDHRCFSPYEEVNLMIEVPSEIVKGKSMDEIVKGVEEKLEEMLQGMKDDNA